MQILAEEQPKFITSTGSTTRFSGILSTSNMVSPPSLQTSTKLPYPKGNFEQWVLSRHCALEQTSTERTVVVDCEYSASQWQPNLPPINRDGYNFGCLKDGLGCHLWKPLDQRSLVTPRKSPSYKCTRTKSGFPSNTSIPETSITHINKTPSPTIRRQSLISTTKAELALPN